MSPVPGLMEVFLLAVAVCFYLFVVEPYVIRDEPRKPK